MNLEKGHKLENLESEQKTVSSKKLNEIEKDMFDEINESQQANNGSSSNSINENKKINTEVQIPKEVIAFIYGGITYVIHEGRIKTLPKEYQDSAREVVKPTEKQLTLFGQIITWFVDRYAPLILDNPFIVPISLAGSIIAIEVTKIRLLSDVIEKCREPDYKKAV
jgi:hypothetical protein